MISIKATIDKKGFRTLETLQKQMPFIVARALTRTAKDVVSAEKEAMQSAFDKPKPYTLNALRFVPATKTNLTAYVETKAPPAGGGDPDKYLKTRIDGGARPLTRYEKALQATGYMPRGSRAMPADGEPRDAFGNVTRNRWKAIIAGIRAGSAPGKKNSKAKGQQLFALVSTRGKLKPGIYERTETSARPVVLFVSSASYRADFKFLDTAEKAVSKVFDKHFDTSLEQALRSAK